MHKKDIGNDLQEILSQAISQMKVEQGEKFDLQHINLAELERRTGITRAKLRRYKADGFIIKPHGNTGRKAETTVLSGFTGVIDDLLRRNVTNAAVCFDRIFDDATVFMMKGDSYRGKRCETIPIETGRMKAGVKLR